MGVFYVLLGWEREVDARSFRAALRKGLQEGGGGGILRTKPASCDCNNSFPAFGIVLIWHGNTRDVSEREEGSEQTRFMTEGTPLSNSVVTPVRFKYTSGDGGAPCTLPE